MNMPKVVCDTCGQEVFRRSIHIENLNRFDLSSKEAWIRSVMALESVSEEVAISWAEHGLYQACQLATRNCPACSAQLRTWRAKLCVSCGAEFEAWTRVPSNTEASAS